MQQFRKDEADLYLRKAMEDVLLLEKLCFDQEVSDAIWGFHAQQALEKLIKTQLVRSKISFPKSHDLSFLLDLMPEKDMAAFSEVHGDCDELSPFAVAARYEDFLDVELHRDKLLAKIKKICERLLSCKS